MKPHARAWCSMAVFAAAAPAVVGAVMTLEVGSIASAPGDSVEVPVTIRDARDLGSLQFDLLYDPGRMEPAEPSVKAGVNLPGAMIEANIVEAGRLRVAMISGEPVNGAGEVLLAVFAVPKDAGGSTLLAPESVRAWDHARNLEMRVEASAGSVTIAPKSLPLIVAGIAAAVLAILVVLGAVARRKGA